MQYQSNYLLITNAYPYAILEISVRQREKEKKRRREEEEEEEERCPFPRNLDYLCLISIDLVFLSQHGRKNARLLLSFGSLFVSL